MPTRQELIQRALHIKALADRPGTPQEGVAARKKYDELVAKHKLTQQELSGLDGTLYEEYERPRANYGFDQAARDFDRRWREDFPFNARYYEQRHGRSSTPRQPVGMAETAQVEVTAMPGVYACVPETFMRTSTSPIYIKMGGPGWQRGDCGFTDEELDKLEDRHFESLRTNLRLHGYIVSFKFGAKISKQPDDQNIAPVWFSVDSQDLRSLIGRSPTEQVRIASAMVRSAINYSMGRL